MWDQPCCRDKDGGGGGVLSTIAKISLRTSSASGVAEVEGVGERTRG